MNKKEWEEHCKWLDTFRGKIIDTNNPFNEDYGKKEKERLVGITLMVRN